MIKVLKKWLKGKLSELLKANIEEIVEGSIKKINIANNLEDDLEFKKDIAFSELIGYKVEIRHFTQEESLFINVNAVMESSAYRMSDAGEIICSSKGVIFIDTDGTVYKLDNVYEYEIRKREVLHK